MLLPFKLLDREEARAIGAKRFFNGKPCPRGHIAERYVRTPYCCVCGKERSLELNTGDPERARGYRRKWRTSNLPKLAVASRRYYGRKLGAAGAHTADDVEAIRKAQRNKCAYCRVSLSRTEMHVDHIVALSRGGSNDRRNLQMLCRSCNQSKSAKDPLDFARKIGRLC